jgi:molecular chaperone DnaJ
MTNPYETLGVRENATEDEIKLAYRELVKKYHPDRYNDNPLKDLAIEKMSEINEAYDFLVKNNSSQNNSTWDDSKNSYSSGQYDNSSYGGGNSSFSAVRNYINMNDLISAERELKGSRNKNAEWFFLSGIISLKKGWYNQGYQDLKRAVNMEPTNYEYREALNKASNSNSQFMNNSYNQRGMSSNEMCNNIACCCCADQFCDCCGADLCACC